MPELEDCVRQAWNLLGMTTSYMDSECIDSEYIDSEILMGLEISVVRDGLLKSYLTSLGTANVR